MAVRRSLTIRIDHQLHRDTHSYMYQNLPVKRYHLRPSSKGDAVRKQGSGTNLSVMRLPGNLVTDRCMGSGRAGGGGENGVQVCVATLAQPPIRGTYCSILSRRAGDFFKTFLTFVRGIVESGKYICWFPKYPDARFRASFAAQHCRGMHRRPIEIVPRLCLSTNGFHVDKNSQSSRFFKLPYCTVKKAFLF